MGIKEEITKIAVEQGYEGAKPKSIAQAIDALADTLAGEDVSSPRSIAGAIHALAPYIGSGGEGGVTLGPLTNITMAFDNASAFKDGNGVPIYISTSAFDISGDSWSTIGEAVEENANVLLNNPIENRFTGARASSGLFICFSATSYDETYDSSNLKVYTYTADPEDPPQIITEGYQCSVVSYGSNYVVYVTAQVPENGIMFEF